MLLAALSVLIAGDCASTFLYHVPQHAWFKLHLRTHHDRRRSYLDHAVITPEPDLLLDGLLGALPYVAVAGIVARLEWRGAVLGLALGQLHVWWRHTSQLGWKTPPSLSRALRPLWIVLPEDHDVHHCNPQLEFGDIFRFYDAPARALLRRLRERAA